MTTGFIVLSLTGCNDAIPGGAPGPPRLTLEAHAEGVPYSHNVSIGLVDSTRVCVIVSFDFQIHCGNQEWGERVIVGSQGSGPGEFRRPLWVIGSADGKQFGVVDGALNRITVYSRDGEPAYTARVPFLFSPIAPFDSLLTGTYVSSFESEAGAVVADVVLPAGDVQNTVKFLHPREVSVPTRSERGLGSGAQAADGTYTFGTGTSEFVRYDSVGRLLTFFEAPAFESELPNARDIEEYRSRAFLGQHPAESAVELYAMTPKGYMLPGRNMIFDNHDYLWLATQRNRADSSYLDVYSGTELLGSVAIRDRLIAFDLRGSTLAALVERERTDAEGLPIRAIDWYRIRQR